MTQKEKQLLLKDLGGRIPYWFTIHRYSDNRDIAFGKNELDEFAHFLEYSEGEEIKPYLRKLSFSNMSSDEKFEYDELRHFYTLGLNFNVDEVDWLLAHHFDYRGLIPMGLALEAPEGMYEIE